MQLYYKILGVLGLAFVVPIGAVGLSAWMSMRVIGVEAGSETARNLLVAERVRLVESTRAKALELGGRLAVFESDVAWIQAAFEQDLGQGARRQPPETYGDRDRAGLPGYGYVHPRFGAWADFEHRTGTSPWVPRFVVERLRTDPALRAQVSARLHQLVRMGPILAQVSASDTDSVDLAWVVLDNGVTNVHPPYEYADLLEADPLLADVDESAEDYVRAVRPDVDPDRRLVWLEPYLDRFKGTWMSSCVAPLYDGDQFVGSAGVDVLLPSLTREVVAARLDQGSYAFLVGPSGRIVAVPERGIRDLAWDATHQQALLETLRPPAEQNWAPDLVESLRTRSLDASPVAAVAELAQAMRGDPEGVREVVLDGEPRLVAWFSVGRSGWTLGQVLPLATAAARAHTARDAVEQGAAGTIETYVAQAILLVLASVVAGTALHWLLTRPIVQLSRQMAQVSWDRLDLPETGRGRRDEIGQLQDRFREMIREIRATRDAVTRKGRELEAANEKLSATNQELRREIGERLLAEDALSREKEQMAVTLRSIGDAVVTTDTHGRVILLNAAAEEMLGWTLEDARGRPCAEVFQLHDPRTRAPAPDPIQAVLTSGRLEAGGSGFLLRSRGGEERVVLDSAAPILARDGEILGVVVVLRDVTERRRFEEEMVKGQKMESIRLLAAGIAHDFNNLLTSVLGNLSLARHYVGLGQDPVTTEARLDDAERGARRAQDLTRQLLTFAAGGAPIRRVTRLPELLRESAGFALRGSNVRCNFEIAEDLHPVLADDGQLSQVVNNLVLNAVQAMPSGGRVTIRARNLKLGPGRVHLRPGRYVEVSISDQGVGIAVDDLPHLFDPFFTTKPRGSGLGLAVCFSILRGHDGHLEVESTPGEGSVFRFLLPATDQPVEVVPVAPAPDPRSGGRLLVMDDDESVRFTLGEMLGVLGFSVDTACEGAEALEKWRSARAEGRPFDAVILDLTVPGGLGGRETLARMKEVDPDVCAIVSSGYSHDAVLSSVREHGFRASVAKPYTLKDLSRTLAEALPARG